MEWKGKFLGVIFSMNAIKYTHSGIARTLLSMTPITIIPFSVLVCKEKIGVRSIIGTLIALQGVVVLIQFK
ncbi:MAG: EamA family transporter [Myxococcota bacterium]